MTDAVVLPDVLAPGLRVVFCGTAAGAQSAIKQAYYAGRGNRFWATLHAVGLTPHLLEPADFRQLLAFGIGLTDACKTGFGMDKDIAAGAFAPAELERKLVELRPGAIAFNGKKAARVALGLKGSIELAYGRQQKLLGGVPVWVLPSTSGAASGHWVQQPWVEFASSLPALTAPA